MVSTFPVVTQIPVVPIPSTHTAFARYSFAILELGVAACLSPAIWHTYMSLQHYVWRLPEHDNDQLQTAIDHGLLVTFPCHGKLMQDTGLSRTQLYTHLQSLQRLGWIRIHSTGKGPFYELGEIRHQKEGTLAEVLYLEGWLLQLNAWLLEHSDNGKLPPRFDINTLTAKYLEEIVLFEKKSTRPPPSQLRAFTDHVISYEFPYGDRKLVGDRLSLLSRTLKSKDVPLNKIEKLLVGSENRTETFGKPNTNDSGMFGKPNAPCSENRTHLDSTAFGKPNTAEVDTLLTNRQFFNVIGEQEENLTPEIETPSGRLIAASGSNAAVIAPAPPTHDLRYRAQSGGDQKVSGCEEEREERREEKGTYITSSASTNHHPALDTPNMPKLNKFKKEEEEEESTVLSISDRREAALKAERPAFPKGGKKPYKKTFQESSSAPKQVERTVAQLSAPPIAVKKEVSPLMVELEEVWKKYYKLANPQYTCAKWTDQDRSNIEFVYENYTTNEADRVHMMKCLMVSALLSWETNPLAKKPFYQDKKIMAPYVLRFVAKDLEPVAKAYTRLVARCLDAQRQIAEGVGEPQNHLHFIKTQAAEIQATFGHTPAILTRMLQDAR